jgi:hypothetical protein
MCDLSRLILLHYFKNRNLLLANFTGYVFLVFNEGVNMLRLFAAEPLPHNKGFL